MQPAIQEEEEEEEEKGESYSYEYVDAIPNQLNRNMKWMDLWMDGVARDLLQQNHNNHRHTLFSLSGLVMPDLRNLLCAFT